MLSTIAAIFLSFVSASAVPTPPDLAKRQEAFEIVEQHPWNAGAVNEYQIHRSCNASQAYQLRQGLNEAIGLAQHAKDHVNRYGISSELYKKYFGGSAPTTDVIGAFDIIVNGNKGESLFRCDDPDGNCELMPTWGGYYRGENSSHETVICPTSFFDRRPLSTLCAQGYNVRESSRLIFWASDLLHRLYHLPEIGQGYIDHYAEGYESIVEAAAANATNSTRDSDGLQYFALEAYALDIISPGEGCPGPTVLPATETISVPPASATTGTSTTLSTSTTVDTPSGMTSADVPTTTASAASSENLSDDDDQDCHSHADGSLHCV